MFAKVENGVAQTFRRKKENSKILNPKQQFSMGNFHFFGRIKTNFCVGGYNIKTG